MPLDPWQFLYMTSNHESMTMKRLITYLLCAATLFLGWNAMMATSDHPQKKLGPEWTKDKDNELLYRRKMVIEVSRLDNGRESTGYTIPMEHHTVTISEADENRGVSVKVLQRGRNSPREDSLHGELEVRKDVKGKVYKMRVELRDNIYFDLDGDGMIDAFIDKRKGNGVAKIVYEGRFVEVEQNKTTFGGDPPNVKPEVWGIGHGIKFIFENGAWKIKS